MVSAHGRIGRFGGEGLRRICIGCRRGGTAVWFGCRLFIRVELGSGFRQGPSTTQAARRKRADEKAACSGRDDRGKKQIPHTAKMRRVRNDNPERKARNARLRLARRAQACCYVTATEKNRFLTPPKFGGFGMTARNACLRLARRALRGSPPKLGAGTVN